MDGDGTRNAFALFWKGQQIVQVYSSYDLEVLQLWLTLVWRFRTRKKIPRGCFGIHRPRENEINFVVLYLSSWTIINIEYSKALPAFLVHGWWRAWFRSHRHLLESFALIRLWRYFVGGLETKSILNQNKHTNIIAYKNAGNCPSKLLWPPKVGGPRRKAF